MAATINFGIDLGTTNSLIAKSTQNGVEIFRNPAGMKETLPSVVAFRKERVLIGDKAKEYVEKDPQNVFSGFKRKMGTTESFFIANSASFITPIELSSMVLRELKNFIYSGETPSGIVITIPASFDTIQSNATREAGHQAGFKEVVLLQEPIAASLAFANKSSGEDITGYWLVYDLGGGTFDVALVNIEEEEMKVVDHEGDNFLGGLDFDQLIISELVVPYLEKQFGMHDLVREMQSSKGKYNQLYYKLLYKAEEAKIALSTQASTDMEFEFTDEQGNETDILFTINRPDFENIIRDKITYSINFIQKLLQRNKLTAADMRETILVGGSTYIPLVRQLLQQELGININCSVDPTTAVVTGAAYYAGSKTKNIADEKTVVGEAAVPETNQVATAVTIKTAYQKSSREREEYFTAIVTNAPAGTTYRIVREDGGYDSGIKPVTERISEMLLLLPKTLNNFNIRFYNAQQQLLAVDSPVISIMQGKFSIYGQPLPNDICLEVDDTDNNITHLELIFSKNDLLPIKKRVTKTLSRSIMKGSTDQLVINVLEGSQYASPQSNLPIGFISIKGSDLVKDLIKGCDVELTFEISESRDITITAYISIIDQEYKEVFSPTARAVNIERMREEVDYLIRTGKRNLDTLIKNEQFESGATLQAAIEALQQIHTKLNALTQDDVTDIKYQLDEQKRKLALIIDSIGKEQFSIEIKENYFEAKAHCLFYLSKAQNPVLQKRYDDITSTENDWLTSGSPSYIKRKIRDLDLLSWDIRRKDLGYVTSLYLYYAMKPVEEYFDAKKIELLKKRGDEALERKNADEIMAVTYQLYDQLINKNEDEAMKGTGLTG